MKWVCQFSHVGWMAKLSELQHQLAATHRHYRQTGQVSVREEILQCLFKYTEQQAKWLTWRMLAGRHHSHNFGLSTIEFVLVGDQEG